MHLRICNAGLTAWALTVPALSPASSPNPSLLARKVRPQPFVGKLISWECFAYNLPPASRAYRVGTVGNDWRRMALERAKCLILQGKSKKTRNRLGLRVTFGGEGGIRTHGRFDPTPDFESGTFDHSATSPASTRSADSSRASRCQSASPAPIKAFEVPQQPRCEARWSAPRCPQRPRWLQTTRQWLRGLAWSARSSWFYRAPTRSASSLGRDRSQ